MSRRFVLAGVAASLANLVLHATVYFVFLKSFYREHPAGPPEFVKQLNRPADQLVGWALAISALTMGFLIALVMQWSGARSFRNGFKHGAILGTLFWASVNFGLYSSSRVFSTASVLVDWPCSALVMTLSSAVAAWVLGRGTQGAPAPKIVQR